MLKEKSFISVVIYLHNNEHVISDFLKNLDDKLNQHFDVYDFTLVNDFSTDASLEQIRATASQLLGNVTIVNMAWMHGEELAILAGKDSAIGDFVYEIESPENDWDVELIWELYTKAMEGFDIVAATPRRGGRLISKLFYRLFRRISHLHMDLSTESITLISRRALNSVLMSKEKFRYRKLLYKLTGFPKTNIAYDPVRRIKPRRRLRDDIVLAFSILTTYSNIGLQIALTLSVMFFSVSVSGGLYAIFAYLTLNSIMEGWTTTMLFLSLGFSGLFFAVALIVKYMSTILNEVQDKPAYKTSIVERLPTATFQSNKS